MVYVRFLLRHNIFVCIVLCTAVFFLPPATSQAYAANYNISQNFTLSNGMQVVLVPNHKVPAVNHMVWYKAGSIHEPLGKSGVAHFLEHLMFKGTENLSPGEFSAILAYNGGEDNAFTSYDFTGYHQSITKSKLELVMQLESERMHRLVFDNDHVLKERDVVLEERNTRIDNNPRSLLAEKMKAMLFLNHPYRIPVIGWKHEIQSLELEDAEAFYQKYYTPSNAILVVTGDITLNELQPLAEKYYGDIPATPAPDPVKVKEPPSLAPRYIYMEDEKVREPEWIRYYLAPSATSEKGELALPLAILAQVLGGGETSRLYQALVARKGIAVDAGAYYDEVASGPSTFSQYVTPKDNISFQEIEQAVNEEIEKVLAEGITEEELKRAKRLLRAEAIYARDGLKNMGFVYGRTLAVGLTPDYVESWPESIRHVTAQQVMEAARHVLKKESSVTGTLSPKMSAEEGDKG